MFILILYMSLKQKIFWFCISLRRFKSFWRFVEKIEPGLTLWAFFFLFIAIANSLGYNAWEQHSGRIIFFFFGFLLLSFPFFVNCIIESPPNSNNNDSDKFIAVVKKEIDYRRRAFEIIKNTVIKKVALDKKKERKIRELVIEREKETTKYTDKFLKNYQRDVSRAKKLPRGKTKNSEMQRIDNMLSDFYKHIDSFNNDFDDFLRKQYKDSYDS